MKEKNKERYYENQEAYLLQKKEYAKFNKDSISIRNKEYIKLNTDKIRVRNRNKYNNDILYKIKRLVGSSIRYSFRNNGYSKKSRSYEVLGCSFEEFKLYLESQFEDWMSWDNHGKYNGDLDFGWDIDHKIPLASAETEDDIIRLNHFSNLQPLCSKVNRDIKKDSLDYYEKTR